MRLSSLKNESIRLELMSYIIAILVSLTFHGQFYLY